MTFRINRYDDKNWIIEELVEGGINPKTREQAEPKWINIGFFGKLEHVVFYLIDRKIVFSDGTKGKEILEAIKQAKVEAVEFLKNELAKNS